MAQALGVVYVYVSGKPPEHRLPQQTHQRMATVLANPCFREEVSSHGAETEGIVELAIDQQSRIGDDLRSISAIYRLGFNADISSD